jgi:DNA-directed RNA polymerase specialized sigma subunit
MNDLPFFDLCEFLARKWHRKMGHKVCYDDILSAAMFGYSKYYEKHSSSMVKNEVWSQIEWSIVDDIRDLIGRTGTKRSESINIAIDELFNVGEESGIEAIVDLKMKIKREMYYESKTTYETYLIFLILVEYSLNGKIPHYISRKFKFNKPFWARKHAAKHYPDFLPKLKGKNKSKLVIDLHKQGLTSKQIAERLEISVNTVQRYKADNGFGRVIRGRKPYDKNKRRERYLMEKTRGKR